MANIKTCRNCDRRGVCMHREQLRLLFSEFPFREDPTHYDSEYLISLDFSDVEYAIAMVCEEFKMVTDEHISVVEEPHHMFKEVD